MGHRHTLNNTAHSGRGVDSIPVLFFSPNAKRATLRFQGIVQTTQFSEVEVSKWLGPQKNARRNVIIPLQLILMAGLASPSSIPVKIPLMWRIARLLGIAVRLRTGEAVKCTEGCQKVRLETLVAFYNSFRPSTWKL